VPEELPLRHEIDYKERSILLFGFTDAAIVNVAADSIMQM
jgi:hypothetical protein